MIENFAIEEEGSLGLFLDRVGEFQRTVSEEGMEAFLDQSNVVPFCRR
jgi:hypothetical protein